MRKVAKWSLILAGVLLVISTAFQTLALCSVVLQSNPAPVFADNPWLVPLWGIALGLLPLAFFLCIGLRDKGDWLIIPLAIAAVGAVMALIAALALKDGLAPQINATGGTQGLTAWKLWYRHLSSVIVGGLTVLASLLHLLGYRADRQRREEEAYKPAYTLAGKPVFTDTDSTIGLEKFADEEQSDRPLKRSQRHALRKQKEKPERRQAEERKI